MQLTQRCGQLAASPTLPVALLCYCKHKGQAYAAWPVGMPLNGYPGVQKNPVTIKRVCHTATSQLTVKPWWLSHLMP
jgi:hypothetical protein